MNFTKHAHDLFWPKADAPVPTRMPPCFTATQNLHFGRRANRGQNRLCIGLGVIHINHTRFAQHIFGTRPTDQNTSDLQVLFARFTTLERMTDLKQGHVRKAARLIA